MKYVLFFGLGLAALFLLFRGGIFGAAAGALKEATGFLGGIFTSITNITNPVTKVAGKIICLGGLIC